MKKRLFFIFFVVMSIIAAAEDKQVMISLNYETGKVSLAKMMLVEGKYIDSLNETGKYSVQIYDFKGKVVFDKKFDIDLEYSDAPDPSWFDASGKQIVVPNSTNPVISKGNKVIMLPYFGSAQKIQIKQNQTLLLEIGVEEYAVCNLNNKCEPAKRENYLTCSSDCPSGSKDGYCDKIKDGICDPDCLTDQDLDCKLPAIQNFENGTAIILIGLVAAFVFGIILLKYLKRP